MSEDETQSFKKTKLMRKYIAFAIEGLEIVR